ncbi:four helix bundle protein [Patescibacteria group bacterium]|nr:four helix bundle protein [Patescibacteria group bacterium]MBU4512570.1 four helix bundle protein [Patescibacteria group bacterium]
MAANIAEGYGAFFFNDTIRFYHYARRSLFESNDWFSKTMERDLLSEEEIKKIREVKKDLPFEINKLIKRVKTQKNKK